ncbi:hypothetical protein Tco_0217547 [Tanacetum coccineum]
MNTSQDIKIQLVDDNVGNQVRHNAVQNDGNEVGQNVDQNPGIQIVKNINGLSVVLEIANQDRNGNVVTNPVEGNGNGINGNPIRCYKCREISLSRVMRVTAACTASRASKPGVTVFVLQ